MFFDFNRDVSSLQSHPQWQTVLDIHKILAEAGFQALIAGGAVRDLLLGRNPSDIDIATDATPEQIETIFVKTVMVGKAFGVSRVILNGHDIEVATFRKDGVYKDGRKPESVEFCSAKEDALRRDFTINGMFYDPVHSEVIDYVQGQPDLMKQIIRTIGNPDFRFAEDKLRLLRAIRFHGQLNFVIEAKTMEAIQKHSIQIHQVSMERIRDEWGKILTSEFALSAFQKTYESGLWTKLFPGWRLQSDVYQKHWALPMQDEEKAWLLWFLIHPTDSVESLAQLAMDWKMPKQRIKKLLYCYQSIDKLNQLDKIEPVDIAVFLGKPNSRLAVELYQKLFQGKIKKTWFDKLKLAEEYFVNGILPEVLVNGDDLIQCGIRPGPQVAETLKYLYRIQLQEKISSKSELLSRLS